MPKRPRQHQIEDESRTAFRTVLPKEWVFRDSIPDYGIDGEVEIFDKNGLGTGRRFLVQLKATDDPDLNHALAILFRLDTWNYYRSVDLPVLIVRFHAPTRKLYVKWFHSFDPYYGRQARKNITFRLSPEDEWREETAARLASDLEAIKQIRSAQIALPITFTLTLTEPQIHGVPAAQIASAIRKAAAKLPGIITITVNSPAYAHPAIVIGNDKTVIDLAGVKSFTLHSSKKRRSVDSLSKFPYDVLVSVAIALDIAGHSNVGAQVAAMYAPSSSIIEYPEILMHIASCMARAHRVTEALRLSEKFFESEGSLLSAQMLMLSAFVQSDSLSDSERAYFLEFMTRHIKCAEGSGNRAIAATAHYNLGNYLRGCRPRHPRLAFHHYRKASEYDPGYLERKYFMRELAGILFLSGRYRLAVQFYKRAIDLGEEGDCCALYADALMFAGRYRESREAFDAYLTSTPDAASEWRLKAWALQGIRRTLGCDEQKRQTVAAIKLVPHDIKPCSEEIRQKLEEALRHDALCGLAWFNLGVLESQTGKREDAFLSFLMASLINRGDVEAWCNAMGLGISSEQYRSIFPYVLETAFRINGEDFLEQLARLAQGQPKGFPVTEFLNRINECLSLIARERQPFEVRLLGKGSDYHVIPLRSSARTKKNREK